MLSAALFLAAILAGMAGLAFWSRRGETSVDPPGVRSLATFRSGDALVTPDEREAEARDGRGALGAALSARLAERLRERGLSVDAPARDDYGWALSARLAGETAHVLLGAMDGGEAPGIPWALSVVDAAGKPGPRAALPHVDAALRQVPGVEEVRWHKRERHLVGDASTASDRPIDD